MTRIKPFRGVLYNKENITDLSKVMCPPYDVITKQEQENFYNSDPHNFIRIILGKEKVADNQKNNKYTRAKHYFNDWLDKNPVFFGVNWCCTMDVAIRACNLLLALPFFKDAKEIIDEPFLTRFFNSIYQHGIYIEENLENGL